MKPYGPGAKRADRVRSGLKVHRSASDLTLRILSEKLTEALGHSTSVKLGQRSDGFVGQVATVSWAHQQAMMYLRFYSPAQAYLLRDNCVRVRLVQTWEKHKTAARGKFSVAVEGILGRSLQANESANTQWWKQYDSRGLRDGRFAAHVLLGTGETEVAGIRILDLLEWHSIHAQYGRACIDKITSGFDPCAIINCARPVRHAGAMPGLVVADTIPGKRKVQISLMEFVGVSP
jgi:hypothetical protein